MAWSAKPLPRPPPLLKDRLLGPEALPPVPAPTRRLQALILERRRYTVSVSFHSPC